MMSHKKKDHTLYSGRSVGLPVGLSLRDGRYQLGAAGGLPRPPKSGAVDGRGGPCRSGYG
jgi:hypothetical protein